jgi:hypothetical protein
MTLIFNHFLIMIEIIKIYSIITNIFVLYGANNCLKYLLSILTKILKSTYISFFKLITDARIQPALPWIKSETGGNIFARVTVEEGCSGTFHGRKVAASGINLSNMTFRMGGSSGC